MRIRVRRDTNVLRARFGVAERYHTASTTPTIRNPAIHSHWVTAHYQGRYFGRYAPSDEHRATNASHYFTGHVLNRNSMLHLHVQDWVAWQSVGMTVIVCTSKPPLDHATQTCQQADTMITQSTWHNNRSTSTGKACLGYLAGTRATVRDQSGLRSKRHALSAAAAREQATYLNSADLLQPHGR